MNEEISGNHGFFSKFSFERLTIWILYLIPFWSLPGILFWSGFQSYLTFRQRSEVREIFNAMHQKIGQISAEFEPTVFLTKFLNQTMGEKSLVCQNVDDWGKALNSTLNSLGTGCAEIMIFDSSNNLIFPKSNSSFDRLCEAFELIRNPPWKTGWKEINYSPVISSGDKIFPQDVHQLAKGGKKARLLRLSQRCTWGYWGTLPGVIARKNLAVLIIIHKEHLSDSACAQFVLKANSSPRFQMGAYNLSLNQALYVPQSVSPSRFQYFSHRLRQTRETDVQEENLLLTSNVTARNTMLIALSQIPIPPGSFFLASFLMFFLLSFPILVFSFRIVVLRAKPKWSIRDKFIGVLCISTGIPAMGILMISSFYISEHEKRLVDFAYQDLESTLDGIENNFPQELENVRADFEKKLNPFMTWPQKGTALSDLLESLENENFCEHAHLVSSSGVTLKRQFLGNSNLIREAIHLPREVRVKKAYSWFCNESILSRIDCAILDLESQSSGPVSLDRYQKLVHGGWGDMISTASQRILFDAIRQFGKDISSAYNLAHGFSGGIEANQMQGLILSSLVEWEAGDLIRNISSNLKRLVLLESNKESCHNYIDIVQDAEGRAQWVLILYNNSLYLEAKYLRKIFASGRLIPKETSFWAISDHSLAEEYDDPSSPGEFSNYFFRLSQTKSRIRDRVLRPQGEQLVSAFRSRNLPHYILIATTPVSRISEAISWERRKINWIIGFLGAFSLFMAFLTAKSYLGPVHHLLEGVEAIGKRNFEYRVPDETSLEFSRVSKMFNSTLSGLKELELARIVQESLLPKGKLEIGQYRFYGFSTMQCQVGGDYFDFKVRDNNCVEVILGDVSGHGLPAALVVAMAKSAFMLLSGLESLLPSDVLTKISQAFLKILNKLKMMTCFLARIDLSRHKLYCSNAGQNAPMLLDRSKEVLEIKIKAFPLGTRQKTNYQNEEVSFPEGGWFVLYSDGVVEALSPSGEMYGYERLKDSIKANCGKSPTLTVEKILANLKAFTLEVPWADDVTVFVIQREEF